MVYGSNINLQTAIAKILMMPTIHVIVFVVANTVIKITARLLL